MITQMIDQGKSERDEEREKKGGKKLRVDAKVDQLKKQK